MSKKFLVIMQMIKDSPLHIVFEAETWETALDIRYKNLTFYSEIHIAEKRGEGDYHPCYHCYVCKKRFPPQSLMPAPLINGNGFTCGNCLKVKEDISHDNKFPPVEKCASCKKSYPTSTMLQERDDTLICIHCYDRKYKLEAEP